ncbi:acetylglutamate kinase [Candidatus Persebacteraceae bacterium Df01]|jgi:acetylglutamate kinase|uniref:Acetylglutamate kinase n=1 Tax=Candidatus Doriopsillibacter californiensis TaxID=2970740 RepID=A0ABT7QMY4_9GAMM|nr:acetylglutamate kinase [Candidatus Persebacteraceae bacterium Df01]
MTPSENASKVHVIAEALPYIRRYHGKTIVIKYGGNAMIDEDLQKAFAADVTLLKLVGINPVVVHGGGPQINRTLERVGLKSRFVEGMRYTDSDTMDIVEMVLGGLVNQQIVQLINSHGARAVGMTGKDGGLIRARQMKAGAAGEVDIGLVGKVESVDADLLVTLDGADFIPVIAPIGADDKGRTLNINADLVASRIAVALAADSLFLLTNTAGVLDKKNKLVTELNAAAARKMLRDGVIAGGMKPKVDCALEAVKGGVRSCRIINGTARHSLLLECFTDVGAGTRILP